MDETVLISKIDQTGIAIRDCIRIGGLPNPEVKLVGIRHRRHRAALMVSTAAIAAINPNVPRPK